MRRLAYLPLLLATSLPVAANVQGDIHDKCLTATDYAGCVKANSEISKIDGNACPPGFAYLGKDSCVEVLCVSNGIKHASVIAGKMWSCTKQPGNVFIRLLHIGMHTDMVYDSNCPEGKPEIGWNSTCNSPYEEPPKKERVDGRQT